MSLLSNRPIHLLVPLLLGVIRKVLTSRVSPLLGVIRVISEVLTHK